VTPFATRGAVAMSGNFGFELDLTQLGEEERRMATEFIVFYKEHRELIQYGVFWRLESPFDGSGSKVAWMFTDKRAERALLFSFEILNVANRQPRFLPLAGLGPDTLYRIEGAEEEFTGAELMSRGLCLPVPKGDFTSFYCVLGAVGRTGKA